MKIEVLYKSHRYEEFDPSVQTCPEPYRRDGISVLTDWNLSLGALEEEGVVLAQHWYEVGGKAGRTVLDGVSVPAATRKVGCALLLVAPDELDDVVWLKKDGEKILWREGGDLINGERFFAMEQLCYSDAITQSLHRRVLAVFDYLREAHPGMQEDEVARLMGYTLSAIERIRSAELAQDDGFEDEGERSGQPACPA